MAVMLLTHKEDVSDEPTTYSSPARSTKKRECWKVENSPSIQRLIEQAALDLEAEQEAAKGGADDDQEDDMAGIGGSEYTYKKSQFWSKEVEEKLGMGGTDPYGLLELEERRWRASPDEIRKAYRRLVLTHHPDKKQSEEAKATPKKADKKKAEKKPKEEDKENDEDKEEAEGEEKEGEENEGEDDADSEFKLLSAAYELLSSTESRRQYDSIDNFNDYLPVAFNPKKADRSFYDSFKNGFARQAKFSNKTPAPLLGDEATPYESVTKFYKFWFEFSSWRDFGLLAEYDYKEAEDREERRWMQRQNKNITDRIKKDERQRVQAFVQLAYDNDPRILAAKEKAAAEKAAAKEAKEEALRAKKAAEEAEVKAKEDAAKAVTAAAEAAKASDKAVAADAKREKEKLRSALKKAKKELKALGEGSAPWVSRASDLEVVAAVLEIGPMLELTATLAAGVSDEAAAALNAAVAAAMQ